jgi:hypothetical protein
MGGGRAAPSGRAQAPAAAARPCAFVGSLARSLQPASPPARQPASAPAHPPGLEARHQVVVHRQRKVDVHGGAARQRRRLAAAAAQHHKVAICAARVRCTARASQQAGRRLAGGSHLKKSSHVTCPMKGISRCVCGSMPPGITYLPPASTTLAPHGACTCREEPGWASAVRAGGRPEPRPRCWRRRGPERGRRRASPAPQPSAAMAGSPRGSRPPPSAPAPRRQSGRL